MKTCVAHTLPNMLCFYFLLKTKSTIIVHLLVVLNTLRFSNTALIMGIKNYKSANSKFLFLMFVGGDLYLNALWEIIKAKHFSLNIFSELNKPELSFSLSISLPAENMSYTKKAKSRKTKKIKSPLANENSLMTEQHNEKG